MYDIAVIGGGPAGSRVAYHLAGMGSGVVVLEQRDNLGGKTCCTGIVSQECVDVFNIDRGVILRRVSSARLFSPSGNSVRIWRQKPQACILDRAAFDRSMAARAKAKGTEYRLGSHVDDIVIRDGRVDIEFTSDGERSKLQAKAVALAAGFGSPLVKRLGLGRVSDSVAGAQAEVSADVEEGEVYFGHDVAPGFFAWLVPISL